MTGAAPAEPAPRLASLDQFRGATVAAMIAVNFAGGLCAVPAVFQHHKTYCSVADLVMPQFFFAVGMAYRLTFLRRAERLGRGAAARAVARRCLGLLLVGVVVHHLDGKYRTWDELRAAGVIGVLASAFQRSVFQTLVHIALASLWVLPVIGAGRRARAAWLVGSAALHLGLSHAFYFDWAWRKPVIDGGPLGFLAWSIPILVGSFAWDGLFRGGRGVVPRMLGGAAGLAAVGMAMARLDPASAAWPFLPPPGGGAIGPWAMSQRAGSVSYLLFASGLALAADALFVVVSDWWRFESAALRWFGRNALAAYLIHGMVEEAVRPFVPADAPGWYVALGLAAALGINLVFVRGLDRQGIHLRL